jgi:hypothetical protein
MRWRHPIISFAGLVLVVGACGCTNKKELNSAKRSAYDTDFAIVYNAALDATREIYPTVDDNPRTGAIKTAWHQVYHAHNPDELANQRTLGAAQGVMPNASPAAQAAGIPTRLAVKRQFIRFDVSVVGGRPWRVKVVGHASEWEPGNALPTELRGPARPHWLEGRSDALTVAIYKRIKQHAVPLKEEAPLPKPEDKLPKVEAAAFKGVTPGAAELLAKIKNALVARDHAALRAQLADDVIWSLGGAPGADTAMAMWQADSESLEVMGKLVDGEQCGGTERRVACPAGDPVPGRWQLLIELRGELWRVTSFVKAE